MVAHVIGCVLYFGGLAILWAQVGWPVALAVFMVVAGNNIGVAKGIGRGTFVL